MRSARTLSLSVLILAVGPLFWLACGGKKPPESPADESSGDDSGSSPSTSDSSSSDTPAASGSAMAADTSSTPSSGSGSSGSGASTKADAPPPAPTLGSTDCGKCIDTTCAKPAAACGKNSNCQDMVDSIHGCSGTASSCIDGATAPTAAKPKKLAAAYGKCAKKAIAEACKAQCSQ